MVRAYGFGEGKAEVADGSLPESNGVLGGYWMIRAESLQDALEWARQCPAEDGDVIEIRQVFDDSDFPDDVRKAAESPAVKAALGQQALHGIDVTGAGECGAAP